MSVYRLTVFKLLKKIPASLNHCPMNVNGSATQVAVVVSQGGLFGISGVGNL